MSNDKSIIGPGDLKMLYPSYTGLDIVIEGANIPQWIETIRAAPPESNSVEVRIRVNEQEVTMTFADFFERVGIEWPMEGE